MPTCFISPYFCINLNKSHISRTLPLYKSMHLHIPSWQIGAELVRCMGINIRETVFITAYFYKNQRNNISPPGLVLKPTLSLKGIFPFNDASLVCKVSSGLYYTLTTRFTRILCTILFYQISFNQKLVSIGNNYIIAETCERFSVV